MNDIINSKGEYLTIKFKGAKGVWELTGTESVDNGDYVSRQASWLKTSIAKSIDTFINRKTGKFQSLSRGRVFELAELGEISAA